MPAYESRIPVELFDNDEEGLKSYLLHLSTKLPTK